jgi:hypothetical protein
MMQHCLFLLPLFLQKTGRYFRKVIVITFIFTLIPVFTSYAQNVSFSPTSFQGWGRTEYTQKAMIEYEFLSVVGLHIKQSSFENYVDEYGLPVDRFFIGGFLNPLSFDTRFIYGSAGVGFFNRPFPNKNGRRLNIHLEIGLRLHRSFSVSYSHISNCGIGAINPGVDHFNLKVHF